jgi:hypothetical protein
MPTGTWQNYKGAYGIALGNSGPGYSDNCVNLIIDDAKTEKAANFIPVSGQVVGVVLDSTDPNNVNLPVQVLFMQIQYTSVPEFVSAAAAFALVFCSGAFVWIRRK